MLRTECKALCVLLALVMLLSCLAACGKPSGESGGEGVPHAESDTAQSHGTARRTKAAKLAQRGIVVENNLTLVQERTGESTHRLYIDGLRDQAVEDRINQRLDEIHNQMYNFTFIPPYRGINVMLNSGEFSSVPDETWIYWGVTCTSSNLLSGYADVSYCFYGEDDFFNVSYYVPFNYNLGTGEELKLADVFYKDTDYITLLNNMISERLVSQKVDDDTEGVNFFGGEVELTAPFKGIAPDQKFWFDNNGAISLVLDYDTPEFFTDYYAHAMEFDLSDIAAFSCVSTAKPEKLYEDGDTVYLLRSREYDRLKNQSERTDLMSEAMPNLFYGECSAYLNEDMSEGLRNRIKELGRTENMPVTVEEAYRKAEAAADGQLWDQSYQADVTTSSWGEYCSISQWMYTNANLVDEWGNYIDEVYRESSTRRYCTDRDGNVMSFEDIFRRGCDIDAILADAISAELQKLEPLAPYPRQADAIAERLVEHISGFELYSLGIMLSFDLDAQELFAVVQEYMPEADPDYSYDYTEACQRIPFRTIRCENLTIFD
ncbi:MAG: hypothetical protein E7559_07250 [Ruminococcaceae bacterium]|nr:hypothetical protein [Oscillospiraceae bacterium]